MLPADHLEIRREIGVPNLLERLESPNDIHGACRQRQPIAPNLKDAKINKLQFFVSWLRGTLDSGCTSAGKSRTASCSQSADAAAISAFFPKY